jgi:hypothetical protein
MPTFLLGLAAMGAAIAAMVSGEKEATGRFFGRRRDEELGQGVFVGPPSAPAGGPGPGLIIGPPGAMPSDAAALGPMISVEPETAAIPDGGFLFGPNAPTWFWPFGYPIQHRPVALVCRKFYVDDEQLVVCRTYPAKPLAYAWGPPVGWL